MPLRQQSISSTALDAYLRKQGSPLAGMGGVFVKAGKAYGVDPRLLVAISGAETSLGKYGPSQQIHNPFGMGPGINYASYQQAINATAKNLGQNYLGQGLNTIPEIQRKWAPSGAENDPTGLNNNWVKNVSQYYSQLGGDPQVAAEVTNYVQTAAALEAQYSGVDNPGPRLTMGEPAPIDLRSDSATPPMPPAQPAVDPRITEGLIASIAGASQRPQAAAIRPLGELSQRVSEGAPTRTPTDTGSNAIVQAQLGDLMRKQISEMGAKAGLSVQIDHDMPVSPNAVEVVKQAGDYMGTSPIAEQVVKKSKTFLGDPYKWGGESPKTGFDCSGFAQWLYGQQGISLPRVTYEQIKAGRGVSRKNLRPGDLIFFGSKKDPHHEGIYIGHGQFIHSPHTGDVIKISSLSDTYYRQHYVTARRVTG